MTVNKVILIGNLGADPESRTAGSGTEVCNLRLATTSRRKVGDRWEDFTEWHRVVTFGKTAENCGRYLKKGRQVFVEGELRTDKWQDKEGRDRWTTEIVAREVRFLGSGDGSRGDGGSQDRPASDIPF